MVQFLKGADSVLDVLFSYLSGQLIPDVREVLDNFNQARREGSQGSRAELSTPILRWEDCVKRDLAVWEGNAE